MRGLFAESRMTRALKAVPAGLVPATPPAAAVVIDVAVFEREVAIFDSDLPLGDGLRSFVAGHAAGGPPHPGGFGIRAWDEVPIEGELPTPAAPVGSTLELVCIGLGVTRVERSGPAALLTRAVGGRSLGCDARLRSSARSDPAARLGRPLLAAALRLWTQRRQA